MRRLGPARRFVVFVAALAFALQSYIAQTHIHDGVPGFAPRLATGQGKLPADRGQADCPLCQAVIHVGVFVAPASLVLILPFAWVKTDLLVFTARAASAAAAHDWRSRAPPRL